MQIEKINNNKLKVILNANDLEENNIDLNTFMANSLESQELFLDILDLAEEEFNFYVEDSKLVIESISLANNIFVFTITKLADYQQNDSNNKIFCFHHFDQLYSLLSIIKSENNLPLYTYHNCFYLIINKNNSICDEINEFSNQEFKSENFENILIEHGSKIDFPISLKI